MMRHLFKLAWRRKGAGSLLILEIFISFLVVFGLGLAAAHVWSNYVTPVGYRWQDAWVIEVGAPRDRNLGVGDSAPEIARMLAEVTAMPEIESAGIVSAAPYQGSRMLNVFESDGREVRYEMSWASRGLAKALGVEPTRGRWFEEADTALSHRPVVIDERLAESLFPRQDPVGRTVPRPPDETGPEKRVIGVVPSYRTGGDLSDPAPHLFEQVGGVDAAGEPLATNIIARVRPGSDSSLQERITRRLQAMAPEWTIEVRPMAHMRDGYMRGALAPLLIGGAIAAFLMLMVGFGLTGVLWQNVTQRTREIGLRRAAGATAGAIQRQVVGEILILATLGVACGIVLVVQLPILDLLGDVRGASFGTALVAAAGVIYALSALCALYPGRMAARVTPAEALHYE